MKDKMNDKGRVSGFPWILSVYILMQNHLLTLNLDTLKEFITGNTKIFHKKS
jgi:hypothetical protein